MYAINHAATALVVERAFPRTSLVWILVSVQIMEVLWVVLTFTGLERVTTESTVSSVSDIHLAHMPWSHSVLTTLVVALILGLIVARLTRRLASGVAIALGVMSHLVLDLITHAPDIAWAPAMEGHKLGLGLYSGAPMVAFAVELAWGIACVTIHGGTRALYVAVIGFNLANLTMYTPAIVGPEGALAGHPMLIVAMVGAQILVTIAVVHALASRDPRKVASEQAESQGAGEPSAPARAGGRWNSLWTWL